MYSCVPHTRPCIHVHVYTYYILNVVDFSIVYTHIYICTFEVYTCTVEVKKTFPNTFRFDDQNRASVSVPFSIFRLPFRFSVWPFCQANSMNRVMQSASILTHGITRYIHAIVVTKFFEGQTVATAEDREWGCGRLLIAVHYAC